jgi:hypothetical protein
MTKHPCLLLTLLLSLLPLCGGCNVVGFVTYAAPPPIVEAQYTGLAGKRVSVMVWADRGIRIDWPTLQLDLGAAIQQKLAKETEKKKPLEGASFPYTPRSVARFQEDHPETEFDPIERTAARIGVDRLVYVEVEQFATRSTTSDELFRGASVASVKVVEVIEKVGRIAYEESEIQVFFPPTGPTEGTIRGSDYQMYLGTVNALADRVVQRFVPYQEER